MSFPPPPDPRVLCITNASCWLLRAVLNPLEESFLLLLIRLISKYTKEQLRHHLSIQAEKALRALVYRCASAKRPEPLCALFLTMFKYDEGLSEICRRQLAADEGICANFPLVIEFISERLYLFQSDPFTPQNAHMLFEVFYRGIMHPIAERDYARMHKSVIDMRSYADALDANARKKKNKGRVIQANAQSDEGESTAHTDDDYDEIETSQFWSDSDDDILAKHPKLDGMVSFL